MNGPTLTHHGALFADDIEADVPIPVASCGYEVDGDRGRWSVGVTAEHPREPQVFPRRISLCLSGLNWTGPPNPGDRFAAGPDRETAGAATWAAAYDGIHHGAWAEIVVVAAEAGVLVVDFRGSYSGGGEPSAGDRPDLSGRIRLERHARPHGLWIN